MKITIKSSYILKSDQSGRFLVAVGETGFRHGTYAKATRFATLEDLQRFRTQRGITWATSYILIHENVR